MTVMLNSRIYPNGEFSLWVENRKTAITPPPDQPDYLGLSLLPNSHRVALGMADPPPERSRRGLKGITRHGARTVRNGAFLLEQRYGRKLLGFYTFTLPKLNESAEYQAGMEWAEIVRIFLQSVTRLLKAAGLPPSYVGCTEIQMARYEKYGGLPLHLHLVMPGKNPGNPKSWVISSDQFRSLWRRSVIARVPVYDGCSFAASVDTAMVKKTAEGYLGKYMTKGVAALSSLLVDDAGLADFLPASWWCCSVNVRRAIGARIAGGTASARELFRRIAARDSAIAFSREIVVEVADGSPLVVGIVGKLTPEGMRLYCHPWHLRYEERKKEPVAVPV